MTRKRLSLLVVAYAIVVLCTGGFSRVASAAQAIACDLPYDLICVKPGGAHPDPDLVHDAAMFDQTEQSMLASIERQMPAPGAASIVTLGKLEIFDKNLSFNGTVACVTCHAPGVGFREGSSLLNATMVAHPGAAALPAMHGDHPNDRVGPRYTMSYAYAPFRPVLHYDQTRKDFVGGNFWDLRATGQQTGNPAADQAEGPPLNPVEMANSDTACVVYKLSQRPYHTLFERVWGANAFAIHWPSDVESVCSKPGPASKADPYPVQLSAADRRQSDTTFAHFAEAIAGYEASPEVSPFSSKFDAVMAGKAKFTPQEQAGFALFNGQALCITCHSDAANPSGTVKIDGVVIASSTKPIFADGRAENIGVPKNTNNPYLDENVHDQDGFEADPDGKAFSDTGVAGFLEDKTMNTNAQWAALAPQYVGKFETPTLRNVAQVPRTGFVRAYMHNGVFHSLKEVVHFYNTRDVLPHCSLNSPGEGKTCWAPPEFPTTMSHLVGNLHLSDAQEDDLVAFLETLTDGYTPAQPIGLAR
jgi:cytochrome c peroxidase